MSEKRILVIDGQVFQTEARHRGMGRYSVCLIVALQERGDYDEVEILLTKSLHFSQKSEQELKELFPNATLRYLSLKTTNKTSIEEAFRHNKITLNRYLSSRPFGTRVEYLVPSPFQEPVVSVFPDNVKKLLLFYDLIPYLYHERYKPSMQYDNYLKRFRFIFEADLIFTISQSVADDLHVYLGIPNKRLIKIDGAPIRTEQTLARPSFEVPERFILMPTSDDPRKNNLRTVLGFEEFRAMYAKDDYKLIITSKIHKREREHLSLFSKNLIFTGSVHESELNWLYAHCSVVLFTPESEGLGLPILEAVEANKKVVCSSLGVFREISEDAFYYCNYEDQSSIADSLDKAISDDRLVPVKEYKRILSHYNWDATTDRFMAGRQSADTSESSVNKLKIAIFTPVPEGLSAIGKIVAESHAVLSEYFDIDYYAERGLYSKSVRPNYLQYVANSFTYAESFGVEKYCEYDAVIYHIGNGDYHLESIKNGLYLPGYAIIHDTNIKEAYRVLSETGTIDKTRVQLEELLNQKISDKSSSFLTSLLAGQLGVMTHSMFAKKAVKQIMPTDSPVVAVNLASNVPTLPNYKERKNLILGLAGIIADVKGIEVIESIANDPAFKDCSIKLFGFRQADQDTVDRLNSYENVTVTTNLTDFDFQTNISKLDVFVNYRMEYKGETSLSTIEAMRQGVVVFVRDIGWYGELPSSSVVKVKSSEEVIERLKQFVSNPDTLDGISESAKKHISSNFTHEQYAKGLLELIQTKLPENINTKITGSLKKKQIKTKKQYVKVYNRENTK